MKVYFVGNFIGKKNINENNVRYGPALKWQYNLIKAIRKYKEIETYTLLQEAVFFKSKKLILPNKNYILNNENETNFYYYINLPIIREVIVSVTTFLLFLKFRLKLKKISVLQYNLDLKFSIPLFVLEKLKIINFVPIVLDLYVGNPYKEKKILKNYIKFQNFIQILIMKNLKKIIVINENIAKDYKIKNYLVIEGGVGEEDIVIKQQDKKIKKIKKIVFTGGLDHVNGIEFCIESFKKINSENIELHFYGSGNLVDYIKSQSLKNPNIKYKGFKKNLEILAIQKQADFLIIPRLKSLKILRYTFPSKIFEYMLSETPVITTNLPGLPEEYKKYLLIVDTENEVEFAQKIEEIINYNSLKLDLIAKEAKKFIIEKKTWDLQAKKIVDYVNKNNS